jgi:hypothetical protein
VIAVARIGLRYFMLHPLQRWLLPLGALCCGVGLLMYVTDSPGRPMFRIGLIAMHLPAALVAGVAFRNLSACRAHGLSPHFRVRMLASLLFVAAGIALTWHLSAPLWLNPADLVAAPRGVTLLVPLWAATLFVLGAMIGSSSSAAFLGVFATGTALLAWLTAGGVAQLRDVGIDPLLLAAVTCVTGWGSLATWYLSTRRIRRGAWREPVSLSRLATPAEVSPATVPSAQASYLTGLPAAIATPWPLDARTSLIYASLALAAGWLLPQLLPDRFSTPDKLALLLVITGGMLVLQTGTQAALEARRARLLWLTHASRRDIFRICEQRSLRSAAWMSAPYLLLFGPWIARVFGPAAVAWMAALLLAAASAGGYLGLMAVRGWRVLDVAIGVGLVFIVYGGIPFVMFHLEDAPLGPAVALAILLTIALTCRTMTERRWRRIDWLGLRPLRWLGGYASSRPAG